MPGLVHCIYTSAATADFNHEQLGVLLEQARLKNRGRGITGILLYSERTFFQVLEGPASEVDGCYARIQTDSRHKRVTQIIRETIPDRAFGDWTMGYSEVSRDTLREIEGLNDFFSESSCFVGLDAGRAKKLLAAFAAGRWRATLSGPPRAGDPV